MKGTGLALITPFKKDYSIDFDALSNLIEHTIAGGVEYLVALGTTGESVTLSKDEKKQVYSFIAQQAKGRVPCVAGIGGNHTQEITDYIKGFDFSNDSVYIQSDSGDFEHLYFEAEDGEYFASGSHLKDIRWNDWTCTFGWPVQGYKRDVYVKNSNTSDQHFHAIV